MNLLSQADSRVSSSNQLDSLLSGYIHIYMAMLFTLIKYIQFYVKVSVQINKGRPAWMAYVEYLQNAPPQPACGSSTMAGMTMLVMMKWLSKSDSMVNWEALTELV